MKISTRGRYALEVAVDLAMHSDREHPESLKNIARRRGLSEKYLERIMSSLKKEGIVLSLRGAKGGYCLAKSADVMTAGEVLNASEGLLAPVECLTKETDCGIDCRICPTRMVWEEMWVIITESVRKITIHDICMLTQGEK